MTPLDKFLHPPLRVIDPKSFWISWVYVFLNLGIAFFLFNYDPILHSVLVSDAGFYSLFAIIFLMTGCMMGFALVINNWRLIRVCMTFGLVMKAFWTAVLIFASIKFGFFRTLSSLVMWLSLTAIQAIVIVYFSPSEKSKQNGNLRPPH
jgi:hypothetical protein